MAFNETYNEGCLEVVVGTMYSGKSKELIERGYRAEKFGQTKVYYFKPAIDTREVSIKSRDGQEVSAISLEMGKDILKHINGRTEQELIIIDEVQFFDESIIYAVQILKHRGYNIVVGGLDKDFRGDPFNSMPQLMALSDVPIKVKYSVCSIDGCVENGSYSQKLRNGNPDSALSPTIEIEGSGDAIAYQPVCKQHHKVPDLIAYIERKLEEN